MQNRRHRHKPKRTLSTEEIYDKGVIILNRLADTDLNKMQPEKLKISYEMADSYIKTSIQRYKNLNDAGNVDVTYRLLVEFYEQFIADRLIDLANSKVSANELTDAIFYFKLAIIYYSKTVSLKQYSATPVLDLHFSVLNALEQLAVIDSRNEKLHHQGIANYMAEYNISKKVNTFTEQAYHYQILSAGYQKLIGQKRKVDDSYAESETVVEDTRNVKRLATALVTRVPVANSPQMIVRSLDDNFNTPNLKFINSFKLAINNFIDLANDQLDQTIVHKLLAIFAHFYQSYTSKINLLCPIDINKKREIAMNFNRLAMALGNKSAAETLLTCKQVYSNLVRYNIFPRPIITYRYDNSFHNNEFIDHNRNKFQTLGGAEYLKQILEIHVDDIFIVTSRHAITILEHFALNLGKKITEGNLFTKHKDELALIFIAQAPLTKHENAVYCLTTLANAKHNNSSLPSRLAVSSNRIDSVLPVSSGATNTPVMLRH